MTFFALLLWFFLFCYSLYLFVFKRLSLLSPVLIYLSLALLNYPLRFISIRYNLTSFLDGRSFSSISSSADFILFIGLFSSIFFLLGAYLSNSYRLNFSFAKIILFSRFKLLSRPFFNLNKYSPNSNFASYLFLFVAVSILCLKANTNPINYIIYSNFYRLGVNQSSSLVKLLLDLSSFLASYQALKIASQVSIAKSIYFQLPVLILSAIFGHRGLAVSAFMLPYISLENLSLLKYRFISFLLPLLYFGNALYGMVRDFFYHLALDSQSYANESSNFLINILRASIFSGMHGFDSTLLSLEFHQSGIFMPFSYIPLVEFLYPLRPLISSLPNPTHVGFNRLLHQFSWNENLSDVFAGGVIETFDGWSILHFSYVGFILGPLILGYIMQSIYIYGAKIIYAVRYVGNAYEFSPFVPWFSSFIYTFVFLLSSHPQLLVSRSF